MCYNTLGKAGGFEGKQPDRIFPFMLKQTNNCMLGKGEWIHGATQTGQNQEETHVRV